jgi:hypothetical protein
MSSQTAKITITPVTSGCQLALTDSRFIQFNTNVRIKAPTNVPNTLPTPPNNEVPPINTAAIAGSVRLSPMSASAEFSRARKTTEASPAMVPETA